MERVQFTLEFLFRASPSILYKFFSTPSCLIRWFCDEVDIDGDTYSFYWDGAEEVAKLVEDEEDERLLFQWEEAETDEEYLEIRFQKSPVTNESILTIKDFCDADEVADIKQLWESQIKALRQETGG